MYEFEKATYKEYRQEITPLLRAHYEELSFGDIQAVGFDPDLELYDYYASQGAHLCYALKRDSKLIGYLSYFITPAPHNKGHKIGVMDCMYLLPKYRHGIQSIGLLITAIKEAEREMKRRGCLFTQMSYPVTNNLLAFYQKLGYNPVDIHCMKRL